MGSDVMSKHPDLAARVVIRADEMGGDVRNAWEVLVDAIGEVEALLHLEAQYISFRTEGVPLRTGSGIDLLRKHGIDVPQERTVTIRTVVETRINLDDWVRDYGTAGRIAAFADAREHVPAVVKDALTEQYTQLGWDAPELRA